MLFNNANLPPLDKYILLQPDKWRSNLSKIGFQIAVGLEEAPNGMPRQVMGKDPTLQYAKIPPCNKKDLPIHVYSPPHPPVPSHIFPN